jgi:NADH-quinone oxidoreductase subunit H
LRSAAQLISYEIPVIMVAISVAMMAQSVSLEDIANAQVPGFASGTAVWPRIPFFAAAPLGLVIFIIASLAEAGRSPFDIYTAESELVGGPFIEYSGAHWAAFFLVEYLNVFVVAVLTTLLFLGAWHGPWLPGWLWFAIKASVMVVVVIWIRGTFPRLRVDQLMALSWKVLIPLSFVNIAITAVYLFYGWPTWSMTLMSLAVLLAASYYLYRKLTAPALRAGAQAFQRAGGR